MRHVQAYKRVQVWPRVVQRSILDGELGTSVCSSFSCVMVFSELMYAIITVLFSFSFFLHAAHSNIRSRTLCTVT